MKKELFKLKLNRFIVGVLGAVIQFWYAIASIVLISTWVGIGVNGGLIPILTFLAFIAFVGMLHKVIKSPMERIHSLFFGSKLEDIDIQIKKIISNITDRKIARANEREDIFNSKIDIITEMKSLRFNITNIEIIKDITAKLNNIHSVEVKKPHVVDITNIGIKKKDFKELRKKATKLVNKVKVSKINVGKLKEIEDILTGEDKRKQEEHAKQLELAQASAQQNVVMVQAPIAQPVQQPMLQQGNQQFLTQPQQNTIQYIEQQENGETNDIQNNQSTNNWNNTQQ